MTSKQRARVLFIIEMCMGRIPSVGYVDDDNRVSVFVDKEFCRWFSITDAIAVLRPDEPFRRYV